MKIFWSVKAQEEYGKVLEYLEEHWSIQEVERFIKKTESVLNAIQEQPLMYVKSTKKKNVCKALITKHNSFFYYIKPLKKEIILLSFWDNRKNPRKRSY
ncbi:MAG: type II toxin-antitoxin system RelE/ParE family toxin [Bacteroidales bacterium]|nr:type II toxin-antitoxin system RelE/ParE family toxin [Bacteroidales bacterium]